MPQWLRGLLEDPSIIKVGSNIKYDYKWLRRFGVRMRNFEDTSTREHLIDQTNPRKDLKSLTLKYLPRLGDYSRPHKNLVAERSKEAGDRDRWDLVRDDEQYQYAAADAEASIAAWLWQEPQLADLQRPRQIHKQLYEVLAEMEFVGACVDLQENRRLDKEYRRKMSEVAAKITRVLGPINLNSPDQLKRALLKHVPGIDLGTNREWRQVMSEDESEELSTRRDILERETVKHPVIKDVLDYRKYEKRHTNYIRLMRKKHISEHHGQTFVHGSYRTDMADTYRLTSSSPPMHNIAKDDSDEPELSVKRQFVSRWPGGSILACDLAQAEFRFAAWESQDQAMIDAITAGGDIHREMAARGIGKEPEQVTDDERYIYKTITFLTMYGGRARKLVETLAKSDKVQTVTMPQARALIRNYFGTFQGLKGYIDEVGERAVRDLMVETAFGYRRYFQPPESREDRWAIQRYAFNTRIQNGASILADLALVWMQNAIEKRKLHSRIIIFRHDEYVLDVYPGEEQEIAELARFGMEVACIEAAKEYGVDFTVPLSADVKIGPSWGETKPMEVKLLGKENF